MEEEGGLGEPFLGGWEVWHCNSVLRFVAATVLLCEVGETRRVRDVVDVLVLSQCGGLEAPREARDVSPWADEWGRSVKW